MTDKHYLTIWSCIIAVLLFFVDKLLKKLHIFYLTRQNACSLFYKLQTKFTLFRSKPEFFYIYITATPIIPPTTAPIIIFFKLLGLDLRLGAIGADGK